MIGIWKIGIWKRKIKIVDFCVKLENKLRYAVRCLSHFMIFFTFFIKKISLMVEEFFFPCEAQEHLFIKIKMSMR